MGLTLLHPRWLMLLAAAIPVVVLYVLKSRRAVMRVGSIWLWSSAQRDLQARSPWKTLRRDLSLFLELTALAALALALASPACRRRAIAGQHVVIVIDTTASMQTVDDRTHRRRIELARSTARDAIDALAIGADAMVITAGRDARVRLALGRDHTALRAAIDSVDALDVEGDLTGAIALAMERLRALTGERRVLVLTDRAVDGAPTDAARGIALQVLALGHAQDNTGIVRLDVRTTRQGHDADVVQAFALVANHGEVSRDLYVTARRPDEPGVRASRRVRVEPGAREPVVLEFPLGDEDAGRGLVVELSPHDALTVDDVGYARIPPGVRLPVTLASRGGSPWIERALEADPDVALRHAAPDGLIADEAAALVVFDGSCPSPLPSRADVLIVAPPAGRCADVVVDAPVETPVVTSYAQSDARFRFLTMDGVHLASATPLTLGPLATALVRAGPHVLFADQSTPERAVTLVGIDVANSDWPLRASFVLFIRNVEELARTHRTRAASSAGHAGEPLRVAVPANTQSVAVTERRGSHRVRATGGTAVFGETGHAGLYRIVWPGGETLAAINLLADSESDLRAGQRIEPEALRSGDSRAAIEPHRELAPWLSLAAALVLLANLFWLTKRGERPRSATTTAARVAK